jgi:hypothetical protein
MEEGRTRKKQRLYRDIRTTALRLTEAGDQIY